MEAQPKRVVVRLISAKALDQYMKFRGESNRSLATKVGKSHSLIAHLRRGARTYCDESLAPKIEKVLNAPSGSLFFSELIDDRTVTNRNGKASA